MRGATAGLADLSRASLQSLVSLASIAALALAASGCGDDVDEGPLLPNDGSADAGPAVPDASALDAPPSPPGDGAASSDAGAAPSDAEAGPDPCAGESVPPSTLACTGLYANFATKELAANAMAYTPAAPLWSDGAQKQRWIELPPGTQIDISNPSEWTFPVGTKLFKEFRIDGQRVETRLFQKTSATFWVYATYAWSADDSSALINYGGPVPVGDSGASWTIPTNDDCNECHRGRQDRILGFEQVSLGLMSAQGLTLASLVEQGLVTPAPASTSLTIGDDGTGLAGLALGWIHVNCGVSCHNSNPNAAGYGSGMLLRLDPTQLDGTPPNAATWDVLSTTINVPCVSGSILGEPRIVPGSPSNSVVYELMNERGTLQMPPIASVLVDTPDVTVVGDWIAAIGSGGGGATDAGGADASFGRGGRDASVPVDAGPRGGVAPDGESEVPEAQEPETGAVREMDDAGSADGATEDATLGATGATTNVDGGTEDSGPSVGDDEAGDDASMQ
ncbi:MAG TPA: hypothetical protein VK841_25030 [Polyangiaceae bacterium]|nr:hypothetical protein [Polyangiaceae bacterium]